jgi:hypothetical protein
MNLKEFFQNLINSILDGSFERMRVINAMNQAFKEYFISGDLERCCRVSISQGDQEFKHEMSSFWLRSGFKINIENDINLRDSEIMEISQYVLQNKSFIRQLMAMGFDTLIVQGKTTQRGRKYSLKAYSNLKNYYIE